jgi:hypothetical protein
MIEVKSWRFWVFVFVVALSIAIVYIAYIALTNNGGHDSPTKEELARFNMTEQQMWEFCGERHMDFLYITQGGDLKCANFTDTVFYDTSREERFRIVEILKAIWPNGTVKVLVYDVHGNSTWVAQT